MCRFTNIQKQLLAQFVVYADFGRCYNRSVMNRHQQDPSKSTSHAALHTSWLAVWYQTSPSLLSPTGERMFVRKLQEEAEQVFQEYIATPQLALADAELCSFHTAINCHICNQLLGGVKVRDHCHIVVNC